MNAFLTYYALKQAQTAQNTANSASAAAAAVPSSTVSAVDPEGSVSAVPGSHHLNSATDVRWIKETGNGDTGWI